MKKFYAAPISADDLSARIEYIRKVLKEKSCTCEKVTDQHLIVLNKTHPQYYIREEGSSHRQYIPKRNIQHAVQLAQEEYDRQIIRNLQSELRALLRLQQHYAAGTAEQLFENLGAGRMAIVHPLIQTDEDYAKCWLEQKYPSKGFSDDAPVLITDRGERVRSKSEVIIANTLNRMGKPYLYERPLKLSGYEKYLYPDFTVLNIKKRCEVLIEHFGKMDDPGYAENCLRKIRLYEQNGYFQGDRILFTFESLENPLDIRNLQKMIGHFLE